jgi:peptidoglycan hydrolase-like protein with peptidoglycan-binding domain
VLLAAAAISPAGAAAQGDPEVAALQVALHHKSLYSGTIDGLHGRATAAALRAFARASGVTPADLTRPAGARVLGVMAPRPLGARVLAEGAVGGDVTELQFELAWRGFPSGVFDGVFGPHLTGAVKRFQRWAALPADGVAGPATLAALETPRTIAAPRLGRPLSAPLSGRFGPRDLRFHGGIDLAASAGTPVHAAGAGRIVWVGVRTGWGLCVVVAHGGGVRTLYAHLGTALVRLGTRVAADRIIGLVGSTGESTGPHLHFEVRVRGALIDPLRSLA